MLNGITMTRPNSFIQVIYNSDFYVVDFPFDERIKNEVKTIPGAKFDHFVPKKWTVPKSAYAALDQKLGTKIKWRTNEELRTVIKDLVFKEETLEDVLNRLPSGLDTSYMKITPFDFQKLALAWAVTKKGRKAGVYGGLLADQMGLGKTIEALTIAGYIKNAQELKELGKIKRCLIVCPATLKMQWAQEIEKFTNENYVLIRGKASKRKSGNKSAWMDRFEQYQRVKNEDIFYTIVNYELLIQKERIGVEAVDLGFKTANKIIFGDHLDLGCILENEYDAIILDEAQNISNPKTEKFHSVNKIQSPRFRLVMTGTPIMRKVQNIFPLLDYISPNILASENYSLEDRIKVFEDKFLHYGWNKYGNPPKMVWEVKGPKNLPTLRQLVSPYMLRRTTEDVSDELPDMIGDEDLILVDWDPLQKEFYDFLQEQMKELKEQLEKSEKDDEKIKLENEINALMTYMIEVCDTPALLTTTRDGERKMHAHKKLLAFAKSKKKKNGDMDDDKVKVPTFAMPPKLELLLGDVKEITVDNEKKVVIFTRFEEMAYIIREEIQNLFKKEKTDYKIFMYSGDVKSGCKRKDELDKKREDSRNLKCSDCPFLSSCNTRTKSAWHFQNDDATKVIIATEAGNAGVNLQAGGDLINYDYPHAFAYYMQRNYRIRRIGSKFDKVRIRNYATVGGMDQVMFKQLMKQKKDIDLVVENKKDDLDAIASATKQMNAHLMDVTASK